MKFKRIITTIIVFAMMFTSLPILQISVSAATQDQAIGWVKGNLNKTLGNGECVDLIRSYYSYLGVSPVSGNGSDYSWNALPSGWSRVQGGTPQKGDILIYTGAPYGHVAIYESDYSHYHQNYSSKRYVTQVTNVKYNGQWLNNYWGYIRPNFSGSSSSASAPASPSVTFKPWSNGNYTFIAETNAAIGQEITVSNGNCGENGMVLYDANGTQLAKGKNSTYTLARVFFNVNKEMGYTLKPGTTYQYKFYAVVNGKTYWSNMQSFKTGGNAPASPSVSFKPWSNGNYTFIAETNAAIGQEITVSNGNCGENGMVLYDTNGTQLATGKNPTYTLARVFFNVNKEMGYTLKPGTKYQYKFYAIVNGKTYWSNMQSFTTSGTAPHAHNYNQKKTDKKFIKSEATCTSAAVYYYTCSCGEKGSSTFTSGNASAHNYNQKKTDSKFLKSSATCTSAAVYYYICSCGEKGSNTFTSGNALGHDYKETTFDTYKEFKCNRCGNSYKENLTTSTPEPTPEPKTYILAYNANGGNNAPSSEKQTENGSLTVSNSTPTRNGYYFAGWSTKKSAVSPNYYGGDVIVMDNNITLYAVWEKFEEEIEDEYVEEYWIFYDANGGIGAPAPVTNKEGTKVTVTSKKPTRNGYNFIGWSESEGAYNSEYKGGDKITLNRNITLYAVWELKSNFAGNSRPSDWAIAEIDAAITAELVPENLQKNYTMPVYRLEVAGMFINLIEEVSGKSINTVLRNKGVSRNKKAFTDTDDENVLAANALGIINGVGNKTFDCYGTLTRGEITAIINRTAKVLGIKTTGYSHKFTDVKNHWCNEELGWASSNGIINGVGNNQFAPDEKLTTEQAIAIVYRAFQEMK